MRKTALKINVMQKKGFTLVELLVVIVIIGVLATIGVLAIQSSIKKGNDAKIKSSIDEITTAIVTSTAVGAILPDKNDTIVYPISDSDLTAVIGSSLPIMPTYPGLANYNCTDDDSPIGYCYFSPSSNNNLNLWVVYAELIQPPANIDMQKIIIGETCIKRIASFPVKFYGAISRQQGYLKSGTEIRPELIGYDDTCASKIYE